MPSPKACSASARALANAAGERVGVVDAADAAAAAAGRGLDHQREADPLRVAQRLLDRRRRRPPLHGATGTSASSASRLAAILSPTQAHHRRVGADEHDAEPLAQLGELGVLGDEAPADPRRVGAGRRERALERAVVEIGAASRAVASRDRAGPRQTASSAWRTNIASRSGSV